jgi:hypothetical protein
MDVGASVGLGWGEFLSSTGTGDGTFTDAGELCGLEAWADVGLAKLW